MVIDDTFILSSRLKHLANEKGLSIKDLSQKTQVPIKTIYGWLAGSHPRSLIDVKRVATCLEVTIDELAFIHSSGKESEASGIKDNPEELKEATSEIIVKIVRLLVVEPESVQVRVNRDQKWTEFEIQLPPGDFGSFLGSKNKYMDRIRSLVSVLGAKEGLEFRVRVKDEESFF